MGALRGQGCTNRARSESEISVSSSIACCRVGGRSWAGQYGGRDNLSSVYTFLRDLNLLLQKPGHHPDLVSLHRSRMFFVCCHCSSCLAQTPFGRRGEWFLFQRDTIKTPPYPIPGTRLIVNIRIFWIRRQTSKSPFVFMI